MTPTTNPQDKIDPDDREEDINLSEFASILIDIPGYPGRWVRTSGTYELPVHVKHGPPLPGSCFVTGACLATYANGRQEMYRSVGLLAFFHGLERPQDPKKIMSWMRRHYQQRKKAA